MAVEKVWIKNGTITVATVLLLFVIVQVALTGVINALDATRLDTLISTNASIELVCISLFLMPSIWLGFAAAMSRHRGVYITLTVMTSLSLLCSIAFLVYEGYVFGSGATTINYYNTVVMPQQGLLISKLVCWAIITVVLLIYIGIAIAGDCSRPRAEFKYMSPPTMPVGYMPPEYAPRPVKARPAEPLREYPRIAAPQPIRYGEYNSSPRPYYKY